MKKTREVLRRVDTVVNTLIEGRTYLVPTVRGEYFQARKFGDRVLGNWPVMGPRHHDAEFFNIDMSHYHIDLRFIDKKYIGPGMNVIVGETSMNPVKYVPMVCRQPCIGMSFNQPGCSALQHKFSGTKCKGNGKTGWICPHKGAFLGGVYVGPGYPFLVCPLHGLKISWATGMVV